MAAAKNKPPYAAFYYLLKKYAHGKELMLIAEISTKNKQEKLISPDRN